jgi:hypothetical protein
MNFSHPSELTVLAFLAIHISSGMGMGTWKEGVNAFMTICEGF